MGHVQKKHLVEIFSYWKMSNMVGIKTKGKKCSLTNNNRKCETCHKSIVDTKEHRRPTYGGFT